MSYVEAVLQPGERILAIGERHWVVYLPGAAFAVAGFIVWALDWGTGFAETARHLLAALLGLIALFLVIRAWYDAWITEVAVTNRRVIYKRGLIRRDTEEMNVDKVETVTVHQSILGRVFGYGNIDIRGTGEGIENLITIADPLAVRSAILTHQSPA